MPLYRIPVLLSIKQFRKLRQGLQIQLSAKQLSEGLQSNSKQFIAVHPETNKKIQNALRLKKGVRIQLSEAEVEASGEGLREIAEKLKSGVQWVKKNVIDTPFYQQALKPLVRGAVDTGLSFVTPHLGQFGETLTRGVHELGSKTGAYGLICDKCGSRVVMAKVKKPAAKKQKKAKSRPIALFEMNHPAMNPGLEMEPPAGPHGIRGGSFLPA